jgi:ethanolamine transporter EutH
MKKVVIVCGLIAGLIVSTMMLITMAIYTSSGDFDNGMIYGYASMLLAFSLIFVGIKNYRDKYNNGFISFGKAFKVGILITLIASTIYVIVWLIDYYFFIPDFGEKYAAHMLEKLKASGASEIEMAKQTKEMASFSTMYKNPFFNALMTYAEIIPVGLIFTLISSFILKKKLNTNA